MAGRMRTPDAPLDASGFRFAVVVAEFNAEITERLLEGARRCLAESKVRDEDIEVYWVPGSFELPLSCAALAETGRFDAVVALGCVVRGETPHFDYVAAEAARGIMDATLESQTPIAFGVLTTEDFAQAEARAGGPHGNKGYDAARTAIEMAAFMRELGET